MSEWKAATLGDLVEPVATWNPALSVPDKIFDYIDLSAVDQETKLISGARQVSSHEAPSRARQIVAKGDVLVSTVRPNLNGVAQVPEQLDGATASTGFCVLRPRPDSLDGRYLFHWVRTPLFVVDMVNKATGASYPAVSDRIVCRSRLPLPPLPEQRRIAEKLDQAEALRAKRRAALAQLDSVTRAIFIDMFGVPVVSRTTWPISTLGEACNKITDGTHHSPQTQPMGVPYITAKHLKEHGLDFDADPWFVSRADHARIYSRCDPKPGDVLYIKDGVTTGLAAVNLYPFEFSMLSSLALLRPNATVLEPTYLCHWLNNALVKREILGGMAGAAIRRLTLLKIKAIRIPIPHLPLQQEFTRRATVVEKLNTAHRASLAELDALFGVLQHRAFREEL